MDGHVWLAFALASLGLVSVPGPVNLLAVSYGVSLGRRRAAWIVPGTVLGDVVAMSASLLGVGALVAASPALLGTIKLAGGAIILGLGLRLLWAPTELKVSDDAGTGFGRGRIFWSGFAMTAFHPGGFAFFTSFAPQFVDPNRSFRLQATIMVVSFAGLGATAVSAYLLFADFARRLVSPPGRAQRFRSVSAGLLIVLGGFVVVEGVIQMLV